jgi:hypothetical protein
MNAHVLPRRFITVFTLVVATVGLAFAPVHAVVSAHWSDTISQENVLVQDCHSGRVLSGFSPNLAFGLDFEISTSYRIDREFTLFTDYSGINHPAIERRVVSVAGVVANSKSGRSLAYDGHFTRTSSGTVGEVTITDLMLHLVPSNHEDVTITIARDNSGVIDSPEAMLLAFAPRALQMSLCIYFAGLQVGE